MCMVKFHDAKVPGRHTGCNFTVKIASANENPLYICGETVNTFFTAKTLGIYVEKMFLCQKLFCAKNHLHIQFIQLLSLQVFTMGEALIYLVCQYPAPWDKQDAMYKASNYKEAKWKEITEILHLNKEDVIKKWKSLRDTYVRHKNIKSKSGDGLHQCKPKWKYYDIMSFIDITLLK